MKPVFWPGKAVLLRGLIRRAALTMLSMRSLTPVIAVLVATVLLAGCSTLDKPRADNYPATGQKKARAVHHWDVLASDVAARVAEKIAAWPEGEHPIHVTVADGSSFNQGFLKLLRVRLLDRGVTLSTGPATVELEVQTQVVQHEASDPTNQPIPLPWTVLSAGVGVWRDWKVHYYNRPFLPGVAAALGVGTGLALDMMQRHTQGAAAGGPTRTEVLITTTLKTPDRLLTGTADMYYIEREDAVLYQPPLPPPPPTPIKQWKVVAP